MSTAKHAEYGPREIAVVEATRPVDVEPGDGERALAEIEQAGATLV